MAYSELIKNFERIRDYMRGFYVYGFMIRDDFDKRSGRSYDNERRRIESYLGDYMTFRQSANGKNIFISIDCQNIEHNPLYKAFKSKSFTDKDITLHFILFDILSSPGINLTISEITEKIDAYLQHFEKPMLFDESTVRKKLKEYMELGLIETKKQVKQLLYHCSTSVDLSTWSEAIAFFSEAGLCGVIGSYLLDKTHQKNYTFTFKHHYITHTLESEILCELFKAISDHKIVTILNYTRNSRKEKMWDIVPLKVFISVQTGRRYLMGYNIQLHKMVSCRLDYITEVKIGDEYDKFAALRERLAQLQQHMWGVSCNKSLSNLEHVEFTVHIENWEPYIWNRLYREKRCGTVEKIDNNTARFSADVFDSWELVPWIRTFICRITKMNFSNRTVENQFKKDIEDMYNMYGISGGDKI